MATFDELVEGVGAEGGFDVPAAMRGGWINEVHQKAVAEAQWQMKKLQLGPTVAGTAVYAVPADVADVAGLFTLVAGGSPVIFDRASIEQLWAVQSGAARFRRAGVFAPAFDESAVAGIELYPVPVVSGVAITALAAMIPPAMVSGGSPVIPLDMHGDLKDGAIALGLLRIDERPDSAALFQQRFDAMVTRLTRRKKSRIGSGSSRMRAARYDF